MKRNKLGQFAPEKWWEQYNFKKAIIFAIVVNVIVWGAVFGGRWYYEQETKRIWQEGFEVGHFEGLTEGDANAREDVQNDFYNNLSKNPKVSYLFKKYFPEPEVAKVMRAISLAESNGNERIHNKGLNRNGTIDYGFFGINSVHKNKGESLDHFEKRMYNLEENFEMASKILKMQGFKAWSTYNNGAYLYYIK